MVAVMLVNDQPDARLPPRPDRVVQPPPLDDQRPLRHAKRYAVLGETIRNAVGNYIAEVESGAFPTAEHSFEMDESTLRELAHAV